MLERLRRALRSTLAICSLILREPGGLQWFKMMVISCDLYVTWIISAGMWRTDGDKADWRRARGSHGMLWQVREGSGEVELEIQRRGQISINIWRIKQNRNLW